MEDFDLMMKVIVVGDGKVTLPINTPVDWKDLPHYTLCQERLS
jgi:hypothetical protein